tara:strand:- start:241 stop:1104 length:864 start_codon:yes stop_codon:yes gene_type:complete
VDAIQFGALFNVPSVMMNGGRCFSYHDGNMAQRLSNPFASTAVPPTLAEAAMAYEKSVYDSLDQIFTMSEYLRGSFINDFDQSPQKVVCIGAGVNLERIPEFNENRRYDAEEILFVGADFERKGGHLLLEAFGGVRNRHPRSILHIVGPRGGPPVGLPMDGVVWHGHLRKHVSEENERLETLFRRASLFVLPSLYEPFGIAPVEAMMHGIPAVVSRGWALQESVAHGETGFHTPPGDAGALCQILGQALSIPEKLRDMGKNARRRAVERFTWKRTVSNMKKAITTAD